MNDFFNMHHIPEAVNRVLKDYRLQFSSKNMTCITKFLEILKHSVLHESEWFVDNIDNFYGEATKMKDNTIFGVDDCSFVELYDFLRLNKKLSGFEVLTRRNIFLSGRKDDRIRNIGHSHEELTSCSWKLAGSIFLFLIAMCVSFIVCCLYGIVVSGVLLLLGGGFFCYKVYSNYRSLVSEYKDYDAVHIEMLSTKDNMFTEAKYLLSLVKLIESCQVSMNNKIKLESSSCVARNRF